MFKVRDLELFFILLQIIIASDVNVINTLLYGNNCMQGFTISSEQNAAFCNLFWSEVPLARGNFFIETLGINLQNDLQASIGEYLQAPDNH